MKIKDGFLLREVAGSSVVVPVGDAQLDFNGMMTLNPVGAFIWKLLESEKTREELVCAVVAEYEVDSQTAAADIERYITKLRDKGIIED